MTLRTLPLLLSGLCLLPISHAQQVRGVNPADIDSRFDVIAKSIKLDGGGTSNSLTLKYDYKLNNYWGLNFEFPTYTRLSSPRLSASGNGDLFARARWITPGAAGWTYGASAEVVLPTASKDPLGTGRYQLNVAGLVVRAVSSRFILAGAVKQTTSVGGDDKRPSFSNTDIRIVPVFILDDGWAINGELRQTWEHKTHTTWQKAEVVLSKQLSTQWGSSLSYSRDFGDRKDRGAFSLALKYFF